MNFTFLTILLTGMLARHGRLRREEGGASVVEWALIAAVVVVAAAGLAVIIKQVVTERGQEIKNCGDGAC